MKTAMNDAADNPTPDGAVWPTKARAHRAMRLVRGHREYRLDMLGIRVTVASLREASRFWNQVRDRNGLDDAAMGTGIVTGPRGEVIALVDHDGTTLVPACKPGRKFSGHDECHSLTDGEQ